MVNRRNQYELPWAHGDERKMSAEDADTHAQTDTSNMPLGDAQTCSEIDIALVRETCGKLQRARPCCRDDCSWAGLLNGEIEQLRDLRAIAVWRSPCNVLAILEKLGQADSEHVT